MPEDKKKIGFIGLIAIVVGSMIGGAVFNLPSNMANGAALGAVVIAWLITGVGIFFLVLTFKVLSDHRPDLSSGIYSYAAEGFGKYVGFNSAWGYWLSAAIGNVSFAVLLMQALGYFFPIFLAGNNWQSILGGSILIWFMNFIVSRGVSGAASLNVKSTAAKLIPLLIFVFALIFVFDWDKLTFDIWGNQNAILGGLSKQVESTMLVTLWAFIGIEGAVVISGRAKNKKDVGKATVIGYAGAVVIYAVVSVLSFGIMSQADLAKLPDPSTAYVMKQMVGNWGAVVINIGVIISILGAWIAWTIMTAEVPSRASEQGVLPIAFSKLNKHGSPVFSLNATSIIMQITILFSALEKNAFLAIISIASSMILVPYLLSSMFLAKLAFSKKNREGNKLKIKALVIGVSASIFGIWLIYAAGIKYILLSTILYALGIIVYRAAWKENGGNGKLFSSSEKIIATVIIILGICSVITLLSGVLELDEFVHWFKLHVIESDKL